MTPLSNPSETMERAREAICMLLMPFFLLGAADDPEKAHAAVNALIQAYNPADTLELDLVARIIGFSTAALDNLRLSMASPALSDTKVLRYRSTAVSLSRSAEQCRTTLQKIRSAPPETKPAVQPVAAKPQAPIPPMTSAQIDKARADARTMLAGLAKIGAACAPGQGLTALRIMPDQNAQIAAAVTAAIAKKQDQSAALDLQKGRRPL
jgi:hypothetical protein